MGPRQRREREREQLRQEILDAARELFVKEGFEPRPYELGTYDGGQVALRMAYPLHRPASTRAA